VADQLDRLKAALANRYRIERELGSGGMATVYLAQDLKHERQVALKVMRPELSAILGGERFLREIRIAAKLNHPNILALHDSGEAEAFLYYVMPYVEGESLRAKLDRERQLSVDEAIAVTKQVGAALDYAHEKGVIHRDIKPENILIHQGQALVADFGIALAVSAAGGTRLTETGLSLGTPEYMSPEQATGERELDARSDVYSLGAVTYEMLVGEPPHTGNTVQAIIAKVVSAEPQPVSRVRHSVPTNVDAAVICALAKTPADRFASGAEFVEALGNPSFTLPTAAGASAVALSEGPWNRIAVVGWTFAVLLVVTALWGWLRSPTEAPKRVARLSIPVPKGEEVWSGTIALSPDGTQVVYRGQAEPRQLWLRSLDELHATPIPATEGAFEPVFSPDGNHLAFRQSGSLKVVSTSGSVAEEIVSMVRNNCVDWSSDGMLYFGSANGGLSRVSPTGGEPELLTAPDTSHGELVHNSVAVLPNGKGALFVRWRGPDNADIAVLDFRTGEVRPVVRGSHPKYAASGHLVYVQSDSVLMAAPFDQDRMEVTGRAEALLDGVPLVGGGTAMYALSEAGWLLYHTGAQLTSQPVWVDRDGTERVIDPEWKDRVHYPALSPDGTRLALSVDGPDLRRDIWIKALDRGPLSRLTFEGSNQPSAWTPGGRFVTFASLRNRDQGIWQKRADGSAPGTLVLRGEVDTRTQGVTWSADGQWLVFTKQDADGDWEVHAVRPHIDSLPTPLVTTEFDEHSPAISRDGRWLTYASNASGQYEVYVRPFPNAGDAMWRVSAAGGTQPLWAHSGRELFYVNGNQELVVVEVETEPTFAPGPEQVLFSVADYRFYNWNHNYSVRHDDQRFVMLKVVGDQTSELMLVLNFFEELKEKVGSGND
jgi:serine/threonine-protein kinase